MDEKEVVTWHVDLEINSAIKISRQQAFIAYNFHWGHFEIKNLSEEHEIYINGKSLTSDMDPMPLESSDMVQIGTEDFIFLLPMETRKHRDEMSERAEESKNDQMEEDEEAKETNQAPLAIVSPSLS